MVYAAGAYGKDFSGLVFNRDISYSGLLGLNLLYPEEMFQSIKSVWACRLNLGFACFPDCGCVLEGVPEVVVYDLPVEEFFEKFKKASSINKTDDVVWLWCAYDLFCKHSFGEDDWYWLYEMGVLCFDKLYRPFYDEADRLYYGQPTFIDIGGPGYPDGFNETTQTGRNKCVWVKSTSTNRLYYKGMIVMMDIARHIAKTEDAARWGEMAEQLKELRGVARRTVLRAHLRSCGP